MLSNRKTSRFYSVKGFALLALALALLMNVTAFASENSRFAFIDTAAEFFGLQTASVETVVSDQGITITSNSSMMAPCTANPAGVLIAVGMPIVTATPGTISVPITIGDTTDCNITGVDLQVTFDPTVISMAPSCTTACFTQGGTVSAPLTVIPNTNNPGHFIAAIFGVNPIAGSGTFLFLNFNVIGAAGTSSPLLIEDYTSPVPQFHRGFAINNDDCTVDPCASPITAGAVNIPAATATSTDTATPTPTGTNTPTATSTPTNTATNTNTPTPTPLCAQIDIDDEVTTSGSTVVLSVTTTNTTGLIPQAFSVDTHITFDPSMLALDTTPNPSQFGIVLGPVGLSNGSNLLVDQPSPGVLVVSLFSTTAFSGSGSLFDIQFTALGAPGSFTPVFFTPWGPPFPSSDLDGFKYNEGFPTTCVTDGSVSISGTVSGGPSGITYANDIGAPSNRHVPGTTVDGLGSPNVTTTSDSVGNYFLSGFGSGAYTIVASRADTSAPNTHGTSITAFDAARVQQNTVGIGAPFSGTQNFVADVTLNDGITSNDATAIATWVVSGTFALVDYTGEWFFSPSTYNYAFVGTMIAPFDGFLMGEVTGNWCDPVEFGPGLCNPLGYTTAGVRPAPGQRETAVTAPKLSVPVGGNVVIPVNVTGVANKGIIAYQFDLRYDPTVIQPQADAVSLANTVSSGLRVVTNATTPGVLRVAVFGAMPISESGVLLNFRFTAVGGAYTVSPLTWENFMLNEGGIRMNVIGGEVAITNPAAAE